MKNLSIAALAGALALSIGAVVFAGATLVHPHTHDPLTGQVVVATLAIPPTPTPTPTPAPAAEPSATVAADIYACSFHEVRGLTYVSSYARFLITPHDFGPAPRNQWGYYTATLWLIIEDQDGNELVRYVDPSAVIGSVANTRNILAGHYDYNYGAYRYKPSHVVDESVTGITCHAGGHFNPVPAQDPETGATR